MSLIDINAEMDITKFYELASKDIGKLLASAGVNSAIIYNDSGKLVTFKVYNYIDTVHWIAAQSVKVANSYSGAVAASGAFFKIHPDGKADDEFLVAPNEAYIYRGPGKLERVEKK